MTAGDVTKNLQNRIHDSQDRKLNAKNIQLQEHCVKRPITGRRIHDVKKSLLYNVSL